MLYSIDEEAIKILSFATIKIINLVLSLSIRYHNSRMINYDVERGINVTTDPIQRLSDLLIPAASVSHAGNYTCVPNNAVPASIFVHIFNGKSDIS